MPSALEIVEWAKEIDDENIGIVTLLEEDETLRRLVTTFQAMRLSLPRDPAPGEECPEQTPQHLRLRWVWSRLEPDPIKTWIEAAGLPDADHTRRACYVAIDSALVYPDGEVCGWVKAYLRQKASVIMGLPKKGPSPRRGDSGGGGETRDNRKKNNRHKRRRRSHD